MLQEDLKDAGTIIQNILHQQLEIPGSPKPLSLIESAKTFDPSNPKESDLRRIVRALIQYPEHTAILLRELSLISQDLSQ